MKIQILWLLEYQRRQKYFLKFFLFKIYFFIKKTFLEETYNAQHTGTVNTQARKQGRATLSCINMT
jgi:pantothenate kinase